MDFKYCIVFSCGSILISFTQLRSSWTPESSYATGPLAFALNISLLKLFCPFAVYLVSFGWCYCGQVGVCSLLFANVNWFWFSVSHVVTLLVGVYVKSTWGLGRLHPSYFKNRNTFLSTQNLLCPSYVQLDIRKLKSKGAFFLNLMLLHGA